MYCDSGSKVKKLINFFNNVQSKAFEPLMLEEGWATSLVGGPYVGRRSPSQARLLNGSSSIFSTTTIVRFALIGKQTKKGLLILRYLIFLRKRGKMVYRFSDVLFCTENIGEAVP